MSALAATVAALLIASPSTSDAERVAANGGFLLGSAHRCQIAEERVVRAGRLIRELIIAAAEDDKSQEEATTRFARFFLVTAVVDRGAEKQASFSCRKVAQEFDRLEQHLGDGIQNASGGMAFRLGDGE